MKTPVEKISLSLIFGLLGLVGMVLGCGGGGNENTKAPEDEKIVEEGSVTSTSSSASFGISMIGMIPSGFQPTTFSGRAQFLRAQVSNEPSDDGDPKPPITILYE